MVVCGTTAEASKHHTQQASFRLQMAGESPGAWTAVGIFCGCRSEVNYILCLKASLPAQPLYSFSGQVGFSGVRGPQIAMARVMPAKVRLSAGSKYLSFNPQLV